ncbi:uncharacterized protein LOC132191314 isoform X2 [Corylus avellana]|uniref:uncharacterized protein LOC132191314 isoform X2 n=1 Tax=Corylus avellana TaxID=13451 RepID=UPI00286D168D|nr:uncharacterized protein LOC132191314 isoform X2 [Corylus avellana]
MTELSFNLLHTLEPRRDAYGFALRPQHAQRYREYANIYKEEEGERSDKWKDFLEQIAKSSQPCSSEEEYKERLHAEDTECKAETISESKEGDDSRSGKSISDGSEESDPKKEGQLSKETKTHKLQTWAQIRPSLGAIEKMMSFRVQKRKNMIDERETVNGNHLPSIEEAESLGGASDDEKDCVNETSDDNENATRTEPTPVDEVSPKHFFPWKEELESLVRGGVPKDLRGEVWQAFVGVKARRVERYYQDLVAQEANDGGSKVHDDSSGVFKKWRRQIEKDIPRTFPGHPALDADGRNSLRRVLLAYARHNPSVGYCQAMNFFAGLLLLLMPEENAFWTLVGIIDDYFDGYYTEEMIESQVDQLVFEEVMRERFPKLVNHLDYLGVQVAWISGPWFLSIFVNMLPWESAYVQVVWLKVELCRLLEEKRGAILRAEELETALMEMVKQDNRRQLSARVELLEQEVTELKQVLADKREQETAMLQVLMRVEQEQRVTEDARIIAEQDAAAQRYAVHVLQEKYEKAMASLAETQKKVVIAESMLEATLQYESGQSKALSSPGYMRILSTSRNDNSTRKMGLLSFGLGWRDKNKGKTTKVEESNESKSTNEGIDPKSSGNETKNEEQET